MPKNRVIYAAQAMVHLRGIISAYQKVKLLFAGDGSERETIREVMKRNSLEEDMILLCCCATCSVYTLYWLVSGVLCVSLC